jgi:hypothetical protein
VSDLHCPATLLLAPYDGRADRSDEAIRQLTGRAAAGNVSRIYGGSGAEVVQTMRSLEPGAGASSEARRELDVDDVADELNAIADLHRGETVLVLLPGSAVESALDALVGRRARLRSGLTMHYGAVFEVAADADGWTLRTEASPTDSVPDQVTDSEIRDVRPI